MQDEPNQNLTATPARRDFTGWAHWKRWRWWKILLTVWLVLVAGWFVLHRYLNHQLAVEIQRIQAQGHPVTLAELEVWYPIPQGRNAAEVYVAAFAAQADDPDIQIRHLLPYYGHDDWPVPGQTLADETLAAMRQHTQTNSEAISLLHEAAKIPHCRYPIDLQAGLERDLPFLGDIAEASVLLMTHAHVGAAHTDAVDTLNTLLRLSDSVRNEPSVISYMICLVLYAS